MKPKNKLQQRVFSLSEGLFTISTQEKQWAYKECLQHKGYANKSRVLCMDCGNSFSLELISRKKAICPHCTTKLNIEYTRKTTNQQTNYFATAEIVDEFQVIRNYELIAYYKKDRPVKHFLHEILQYWVQPDLKTTMVGLLHSTSSFCDSWGGKMEIREAGKSYYNRDKYDVYARKYHPKSVFKKEYMKYGIDHNLKGLSFNQAVRLVPRDPKLETLLKAKQYGFLEMGGSYRVSSYWSTIKICMRNKYQVHDYRIYLDYLELLTYFKKDIQNAKYVCPKDLNKQHDILMKKKREILRLQEVERERIRVIKRQENVKNALVEYVNRMKKFFDLEFKKGNISITVLKNIDEFKEEGDELKHCVFTNEYYLREKSLILSAKVDGKRTETIEVIIPGMKIEQSRGIHNKSSEHHDQIVELVNKNLGKIRKIVRESRKEKEVA